MPDILVKTKHESLIPTLYQGRKPGYELIPVAHEDPFSELSQDKEIHAVIADFDLITPAQVRIIKETMDDEVFPVILITTPDEKLSNQDAGRWLSIGVSDIFLNDMPAPLMARRLGTLIQLYCVTQSLHGQVTDKLTGLHNRDAFYHFARRMIDIGPEDDYAIILSDIENFKRINERFGEQKGDALLKYVGKCLEMLNNENCLFARYGGDQFVGILRHPKEDIEIDEDFLKMSMDRFYAEAPIDHFSVQFGIYENVDKTLPVSIMCDRALMALKPIKHKYGENIGKYTPQIQQRFDREQQIIDSMENAIREHQFKVYYQPKHDMRTSKLVGAEALVRWNHPVYGFMSPADFIPLFEQSGFIRELDKYVWEQVCRDVKDMICRNLPVVPVSINASRKDLLYKDFIEIVDSTLAENNLGAEHFHIELTESIYMDDTDLITVPLEHLRKIGIMVELDDFGSGFSSLGILSSLPIDIVKLDISLINELEKKPAIVENVIKMMHALGYKVTAEGVENNKHVSLLRKMKCDHAQGYYYSKPLTYEGFCEYMESVNNYAD